MGNNISANTLFHFTETPEKLINILADGFHPVCCMESFDFITLDNSPVSGFAIPMVSFCDIPLSQISRHVEKYGGYAIGLSKEWGEKNGINPVMYELPNSNAVSVIRDTIRRTLPYLADGGRTENKIENVFGEKSGAGDDEYLQWMRKLCNRLIYFSCYLKPYKSRKWDGRAFSGNEIINYDEKEWRYIPDYEKVVEKSLRPYLSYEEYLDEKKKEEYNELFRSHFSLSFRSCDIKYIIVEREDEVLDMARMVENVKSSYGEDEVKLLITKIISVERLRDDF